MAVAPTFNPLESIQSSAGRHIRLVRGVRFLVIVALFHLPSVGAAETQTELLDGAIVKGQVKSIDADGSLHIVGHAGRVPLDGVRRIQRTDQTETARPHHKFLVMTTDGGRLQASQVTCADERIQITWPFGALDLPIELVRAVRLRRTLPAERFAAALARHNREKDTLFVTIGGKLQEIEGFLESLTSRSMQFEWQEATRTVPFDQVHGFVLALIEDAPGRAGRCRVDLDDGSNVYGKLTQLHGERLSLNLSADVELSLPWPAVRSVAVFSERLRFLSDADPTNVIQETIVTLKRSWQRDKSIEGRPLTIGGRHFEKGLGVQSRSLLTFSTDDSFDQFIAHIGIDDETDGRGDCVFVVRGDDRELFRRRVRGGDPAFPLRIDISGLREVTLLVEPGKQLDMADHADWCDARFLRNRKH